MAYTNHLLFNNIFLQSLSPTEEEKAAASYLVHSSARDWFRDADLSTPAGIVDTWIKPLLNLRTLDLAPAELEDKSAWIIVAPWDRQNPLALCYVVPHGTDLDGYTPEKTLPKGEHWMIRAINLARNFNDRNLRWVVLTNGERWRLLDACSLRRYEAFLEIDLYHLLTGEDDPMAAYLFYRLLRLEDSLERDEKNGQNKLDTFLEQSIKATQATENYLKTSVSDNLNTPGGGDGIMAQLCIGLVQAIDPQGSKSFTDQERDTIYRDATYLLYRLLFIMYAEARNLLPMDRADYRAVSLQNLINEAAELHREPLKGAERPTSLWNQLNTLFNAIHYSDEYLGIPPYNGGLFDNKDKPYLQDYAIENKFLAEALYELAFFHDPNGALPPEQIDYRDLSVRHLGSLYEGMIEYKLFIAEEKFYARRGKDSRVEYLSAAVAALKPNDEIIEPGKVYFAQNPRERKATGTHYTAEELVERLVRHTVVRLLEERSVVFAPTLEKWLHEIEATPGEAARIRLQNYVDSQLEAFVREQVLSLRICDPAMGSGHFLVHIVYTIANFILQVLTSTPWDNPAVNLDANYWRKLVVENCLYGVDVNGMAVELAKLSLWLATMQPGRPLSFLDHRLKRGNSLLGARLDEITGVLTQSDLNKQTRVTRIAEERGQYSFREIPQVLQKLEQANRLLERITGQIVDKVEDIAQQEADYETVQRALAPYIEIGDLLVASKMGWKIVDKDFIAWAKGVEQGRNQILTTEQEKMLTKAKAFLSRQHTVHWKLDFSGVFFDASLPVNEENRGFDVLLGNPPYLGGAKISSELGDEYLRFLKAKFPFSKQNTDLCAYFFVQGYELLANGGFLGFVATNTIAEGDTRESGLELILRNGGIITYADRYVTWPGEATIEVNLVTVHKPTTDRESSRATLDGRDVDFISSWLDELPEISPKRLQQNKQKAFKGAVIHGTGFLLSKKESQQLIAHNPRNAQCIFPYLVGRDVNNDPQQKPSRMVINFHDWSIEKTEEYPELIDIIRAHVKPHRDTLKRKQYREKWWLFAEYCVDLRRAILDYNRVLVRSRVSELHMLSFVEKGIIYSDAIVVFAFDDYYRFAMLQSSIHEVWLRRQASSLRTDIRYTSTDCFQTFPFSQKATITTIEHADIVGQLYYEHRQHLMVNRQIGLTSTYNLFNDPNCELPDIQEMRRLHAEMDQAVLACYGWQDIDLDYDFYPNDRKKIRFMPSPNAQREIFTRLTELNQEIAEQEAAEGLSAEANMLEEEEGIDDDKT